MIGWKLSRIIIDIPWLHNLIGFTFLTLLLLLILLIPYILYRVTRSTGEKQKEWSFEGKPWSYWKQYK
jgi:ABC-type transport system involved in cytochrome bd biosynthesis fused ATPase/permease subunit